VSEHLGLDALFSLMNKNAWYVVDIISNDMESIGMIDRTSLNSFIQARKKELKS